MWPMNTDTRELLAELREDHRNMARVLDLMEAIVTEMEAGKDPDFELFDEAMRYMTVYPDAVHHPKEDVIYEQLRVKRPDLGDGLDNVPEEHAEIARLGSLLRSEVDAIVAGAAVRREKMIEDTSAYVARLREHIGWEERDLFKRIDAMLDKEEGTVDVAAYEHIKDPVFELEVEAGFRRLIQSLR